jgi:toxin ParE1/3/4
MAGPRPSILWSPHALADLSHIWSYYADVAGPQIADKIVRDINQACRLLDDHPLAGRARPDIRPGLRSIAANPHVVFYRVTQDVAEIVRVLDGRRDIEEIFSQDES